MRAGSRRFAAEDGDREEVKIVKFTLPYGQQQEQTTQTSTMRTHALILLAASMTIGAHRMQAQNRPTVVTSAATSITTTAAGGGGTVTLQPLTPVVTERGVVWSTSSKTPVSITTTNKVVSGSGAGTFTCKLQPLLRGTKYYAWAYAKNSQGLTFGNMISFTTQTVPAVTTTAITAITGSGATSGGNVTNDGGSPVTARGVCWSTSTGPTVSLTTKTTNGTGTGAFTSTLAGLGSNRTYYVRAYATNSAGTGYGPELTFTTLRVPKFIDLKPLPTSTSAENRPLLSGVASQQFGNIAFRSIDPIFCAGLSNSNGTLVDDFSCGNGGARCKVFEHTITQLPPVIYKAINAGDSASGSFTVELYRQEKVNGTVGALSQVQSSQVVGLSAGATSGTFSFTPMQTMKVYTQDWMPGKCFLRRDVNTTSAFPYMEEAYLVKVDGGNAAGGGVVRERTETNNEGDPMPAP